MDLSKEFAELIESIAKETEDKIKEMKIMDPVMPKYPLDGESYSYNFNIDNIKEKVDAIQWTGDNMDQCMKFVNNIDTDAFVFLRDQTLIYEYEHGTAIKEVHPYDYLVKFKKCDYCQVISDDTFKFMFGMYDKFNISQENRNSPDRTDDNNIDFSVKDQYGSSLRFKTSADGYYPSGENGLVIVYYTYKSSYGDILTYVVYKKNLTQKLTFKDQYGNKAELSLGGYDTSVSATKKNIDEKIIGIISKSVDLTSNQTEKIKNMVKKSINLM